jgi:hypothetical protein
MAPSSHTIAINLYNKGRVKWVTVAERQEGHYFGQADVTRS